MLIELFQIKSPVNDIFINYAQNLGPGMFLRRFNLSYDEPDINLWHKKKQNLFLCYTEAQNTLKNNILNESKPSFQGGKNHPQDKSNVTS